MHHLQAILVVLTPLVVEATANPQSFLYRTYPQGSLRQQLGYFGQQQDSAIRQNAAVGVVSLYQPNQHPQQQHIQTHGSRILGKESSSESSTSERSSQSSQTHRRTTTVIPLAVTKTETRRRIGQGTRTVAGQSSRRNQQISTERAVTQNTELSSRSTPYLGAMDSLASASSSTETVYQSTAHKTVHDSPTQTSAAHQNISRTSHRQKQNNHQQRRPSHQYPTTETYKTSQANFPGSLSHEHTTARPMGSTGRPSLTSGHRTSRRPATRSNLHSTTTKRPLGTTRVPESGTKTTHQPSSKDQVPPRGVKPLPRNQTDSDIVFPDRRFLPTIGKLGPNCARGSTFCTATDEYPSTYLANVLSIQKVNIFRLFQNDTIDLGTRISDQDETELCQSEEQIVYPKVAENKDEQWMFVVNQGEYSQGVRVERCMKEGGVCSLAERFPQGYSTSCKQKYIYRKLVALSGEGKPVTDHFRIPSCCACFVKPDVGFKLGAEQQQQQQQQGATTSKPRRQRTRGRRD